MDTVIKSFVIRATGACTTKLFYGRNLKMGCGKLVCCFTDSYYRPSLNIQKHGWCFTASYELCHRQTKLLMPVSGKCTSLFTDVCKKIMSLAPSVLLSLEEQNFLYNNLTIDISKLLEPSPRCQLLFSLSFVIIL